MNRNPHDLKSHMTRVATRPGFKTLCPASRMNPIRDANVPDFPQDIVHIVKIALMIQLQCTNF